jgi:hypothetical protein
MRRRVDHRNGDLPATAAFTTVRAQRMYSPGSSKQRAACAGGVPASEHEQRHQADHSRDGEHVPSAATPIQNASSTAISTLTATPFRR